MNFMILFLLISSLILPSLSAGVILTKARQATVGHFVENETSVILQVNDGAVEYKKENLLWFDVNPSTDSLFKAGLKARDLNQFIPAMVLLELSSTRENDTQSQAQLELQKIKDQHSEEILQKNVTPSGLSPEEKLARGKSLVHSGTATLNTTHLDASLEAASKNSGAQNISEGKRLIAEASAELAVKKASEEVKAREQAAILEKANLSNTELQPEERRANLIAGSLFALIVLIALWKMTVAEPKQD